LVINSSLRLGQLELAVLNYLWAHETCCVKSLHAAIGIQRGISLNTVQSTLERLFKKKLLSRIKVSHAYQYKAAVDRTQLLTRRLDDITSEIAGEIADGQTNFVLAAFIEFTARLDDTSLERLEQLITQHKNKDNVK